MTITHVHGLPSPYHVKYKDLHASLQLLVVTWNKQYLNNMKLQVYTLWNEYDLI